MKYLGLTLSSIAVALLAIALFFVAREMGRAPSVRPLSAVALPPLTEQQIRDQAQLKDAVQSWSNASSSRPAALMQVAGSDAATQKLASRADFPGDSKTIFALSPSGSVSLASAASLAAASNAAAGVLSAASSGATVPAKVVRRPDGSTVAQVTNNAIPLPNVSVVLEGGQEGKAVVDGRLVRVGDKLADGLVLKSIQMDVVTFSSGKEDLQVLMPLPRLRVLGAVAKQGKDSP